MKKAFILILLASLLTITINAQELTKSNTTYNLKQTKTGHYTLPIHINNSVEAQALLESGIHAMLIDSAFAFKNQYFLTTPFTRVNEKKINLGGKVYKISHQAKVNFSLNDELTYSGEVFLIPHFYENRYEIALPIQNIHHANGRRCIKLNFKENKLQVLSQCDTTDKWYKFPMNTDTYMGMPAIKANLYFINKEFNTAFSGNFNIDLGNASLLFLFKQSLAVQNFMKNNPSLKIQKGFDKQGNFIAEVFELNSMLIGNIKFTNPTIAITHLLPKFTTDGCIGLKFFKQSEVIFDFDNNMFYISRN